MSPIAYFVFNRPHHTERTFAEIRKLQPTQLFIIADGPRQEHPEDFDRCIAVRTIVEQIDWHCDVYRNYANLNLGLKIRVSSGLDWVFSQVDRAIILEDDCLPHQDFFIFCDELLKRFADDERVSVITGNNFQAGHKRGEASYYFSKYPHCWGWATWRRSWLCYQGDLIFWPELRSSLAWHRLMPDKVERSYWNNIFENVCANKIDSWAYPWTASVWLNNGLTATPNVNLVSNIGFGAEATHTISSDSIFEAVPSKAMGIMTHPTLVIQDIRADQYVFEYVFKGFRERFPYFLCSYLYVVARKLLIIVKNKVNHA